MPLLSGDALTQLAFSVHENKGVYALLLGSGLSRAADIPTGWEITLDLIRRVGTAQGAETPAKWDAWYREQTGEEPNYSALLEEIASSPDERRAILQSYIEPSAEDRELGKKVPTAAHYAIADLVRTGSVRVIVTTNFDRLLETALRERGVEPTVVGSADALKGAEPLTHTKCFILKLHGDYKDARILNTDTELSAYPPEYEALLDRILDEHGLVIAGWSGAWDHALRAALLRAPARRYPTYWASRGSPPAQAEELIDQRKARLVTIADADTFFCALRDRVETLEQSGRRNPLSVDLAVSTTKRFLARPEHRIQLADMIGEAAVELLQETSDPELGGQGTWSAQEFENRRERYEAATEMVAKIAGTMGRWGDGSELPLITDVLAAQYAQAEDTQGGLVVWLGMRSYPAVLLFTAYGLGLARAERWATFHALCETVLHRESSRAVRVVDAIFGGAWKGADKDLWKHVEGLDRRHTPLSDYLCELMRDWAQTFSPLTPDFELLFERFEIVASLAHATRYTDQELIGGSETRHVWIGVGRFVWDSSRREKLYDWLTTEPGRSQLLGAGFANGKASVLDAILEHLKSVSSRMW